MRSRWTKAMLWRWKALPMNDGGCASCGAWRRTWRPHLAALVRSVDCLTRHQRMAGSHVHHLRVVWVRGLGTGMFLVFK